MTNPLRKARMPHGELLDMAEPQLRRMNEAELVERQERQERLYELVDGFPVLPLR